MPGLGERLQLPVLGDRGRCAVAKADIPTRLATKTASKKADEKAWETCKRLVDVRDKYACRCCGRKTVKTLELIGNRSEHHHLATRRKDPELLTDVRNVLLLCLECHTKVTRRQLHAFQKAAHLFVLGGRSFINADKPVEFVAR